MDQFGRAYDVHIQDEDGKPVEEELMYWRKHNRLQGWMERLWREKIATGEAEDTDDGSFNCVRVYLTERDLDRLEKDISEEELPETVGFFFGKDSYTRYEDYAEYDREFIRKAREALQAGMEVYYSSWW